MGVPLAAPTLILQCAVDACSVEQTLCANGIEANVLRSAHDCRLAPACHWLETLSFGHEARLTAAIEQTIHVLQCTRHAFKSKELAQLRRGLEQLLQELSALRGADSAAISAQ